jgi:hypothetical protein
LYIWIENDKISKRDEENKMKTIFWVFIFILISLFAFAMIMENIDSTNKYRDFCESSGGLYPTQGHVNNCIIKNGSDYVMMSIENVGNKMVLVKYIP